jgi:hypothetical protein
MKKGASLAELVTVLTLLSIIAFGFSSYIFNSMQAWVLISSSDAAISTARISMSRILAELRRIKKPENILTSTTSECRFIDIDSQQVDFKQSGSDLLRNADILAAGLVTPDGLRFTYLNTSGEATSVKQDMRTIRVWIYLTAGPQRTMLESSARIRSIWRE